MAIARSMLKHLDNWPNKPGDVELEDISKDAPSIMLMHIPTAGVVRKYVNGSILGEWCFAVYLRINKADISDKLTVFDLYADLWKYLTENELPVLMNGAVPVRFEQLNTPSQTASYDNGTEDYQTNYRLLFRAA